MLRAETDVQEEICRLVVNLSQGQIFPLRETRRAMVQWALRKASGNVTHAAEMLGVSRGTIYRYAGHGADHLAKTAT